MPTSEFVDCCMIQQLQGSVRWLVSYFLRYEFVTAVTVEIAVVLLMTPVWQVRTELEGNISALTFSLENQASALKYKAAGYYETSLLIDYKTWRQISYESLPYSQHFNYTLISHQRSLVTHYIDWLDPCALVSPQYRVAPTSLYTTTYLLPYSLTYSFNYLLNTHTYLLTQLITNLLNYSLTYSIYYLLT